MNKKLVALAVAGAFALPLAAEAQTAQVTLYGRANMDLEFVKASGPGAADGSTSTVTRVASNSSRFGLRGTEALGGGLTAFFQVENSVELGRQPERQGVGSATRSPIAKPSSACKAASARSGWAARSRRMTTRRRSGRRARSTTTPACSTTRACGRTTRTPSAARRSAATTTVTATASAGTARHGPASPRKSRSRPKRTPVTAGRSSPGVFYNNGPIQGGLTYARHDKIRCYNAAGTVLCAPAAAYAVRRLRRQGRRVHDRGQLRLRRRCAWR